VKVHGETLVSDIGVVHEGLESIDRDGVVSKSKNTRHLGDVEAHSGNLGNLTEAHGGLNITNSGNILSDSSSNASRSVLDVEFLSVLLVSG